MKMKTNINYDLIIANYLATPAGKLALSKAMLKFRRKIYYYMCC
jgi:hypothetical protein